MAPQGPTHGKAKLASRIGPAGWPAHSGGTRGDCARTGGSGLCRRQLRNRRMSSDGAGVGGELGAGAAGDGDGADDDGEEGDGLATAPARALPAADVEDDGEAPSTSSASVGTVEGGATAAAAPTDSVMMVDLAATAQDFFSGTDGPARASPTVATGGGNRSCCHSPRGRRGRSPESSFYYIY